MSANPPDKSPDRIFGAKPLEPAGTTPKTPANFEGYMQNLPKQTGGPASATPMQGVAPPAAAAPPTMASMAAQAKSMQDSLGNVGNQLRTKNLKLRRSQTHLLKNKLTEANSYIRQAASKVGVDSPPLEVPSGTSALDRFLAYVNDGQNQLIEVQHKLKTLSAEGGQINAADMLAVTVKMNLAQQEIEYSSVLLSKVIESIKQIMNVQL